MSRTVEETLLVKLEESANMMRGVALDPRVPQDTKTALRIKAAEIDELVERYCE